MNLQPRQSGNAGPTREDALSDLLTYAFDALSWISEAPNRGDIDGISLELAVRAREACAHIERNDPDKEWTGPMTPQSRLSGSEAEDYADRLFGMAAGYQMALRVVYELLDGGPGNAAQLAERMTEKDEDGQHFEERWVDDALGVLDGFALLDYPSLDDGAPVALKGLA